MRLKHILYKLICREKTLPIMVDNNIYSDNKKSYSGGSLADTNILFVKNKMLDNDNIISEMAVNERFVYTILQSNNISIAKIVESGLGLIGPFTHIVNIFNYSDEIGSFTFDGSYNDSDILYDIHQTIQQETVYLKDLKTPSYLSIVYIDNGTIESISFAQNIVLMIKGLSRVLGNHGIICNGIIASNEVPIPIVYNAISFINSKYGTVLAGEVLRLK